MVKGGAATAEGAKHWCRIEKRGGRERARAGWMPGPAPAAVAWLGGYRSPGGRLAVWFLSFGYPRCLRRKRPNAVQGGEQGVAVVRSQRACPSAFAKTLRHPGNGAPRAALSRWRRAQAGRPGLLPLARLKRRFVGWRAGMLAPRLVATPRVRWGRGGGGGHAAAAGGSWAWCSTRAAIHAEPSWHRPGALEKVSSAGKCGQLPRAPRLKLQDPSLRP